MTDLYINLIVFIEITFKLAEIARWYHWMVRVNWCNFRHARPPRRDLSAKVSTWLQFFFDLLTVSTNFIVMYPLKTHYKSTRLLLKCRTLVFYHYFYFNLKLDL